MSDKVIEFPAEIIKIQTMVDGAIRVTLDLSADKVQIAAQLMEAKQRGAVLEVAAVPVLQIESGENGKVSKGSKRQSKWTTAEESSANRPTGGGWQYDD